MHFALRIVLISSLATPSYGYLHVRQALAGLQKALATYEQKHELAQRTTLIRALQQVPPAPLQKNLNLLWSAAASLTHCPHVDHRLFEHRELITQSYTHFATYAGFGSTLHTLLARHEEDSFAKGYTYELFVARKLYEQGCKVTGFGVYLYHHDLIRQFDLQTPHSLIECKNIRWPLRDRCDTRTLDQQFLDQRHLVAIHHERLKDYVVCSNDPIPDDWLTFFRQHEITTLCITMP
jgi:hypothetical protein